MSDESRDQVNMGIGLMNQGKYAEAKECFKAALKKDPADGETFIHLGNACASNEDYDEAIQAFSNALLLQPDSGEILFSIGNLYYLKNDYQKAVKYYNKAEAAGFDQIDLWIVLGDIFAKADDSEQVLRCVNRALKIAPLRGDLWREKILILIDRGSNDAALEALEEFSSLLPDAYDAYDLQTRLFLQLGKVEEACATVQKAVERFPEDPAVRLLELYFCVEAGEYDKAGELSDLFEEKGWTEGNRRTIAIYKSQIYLAQDKVKEVPAVFEWALEESPKDEELLYLLLSTYLSFLDYEKVIQTADRFLALENANPSMMAATKFYRASSMKALGKTEEATEEFKKLTKELRKITIAQPGLYDVYMYRLMCHTELEEFNKALELAEYLSNVAPDRADGHAYKYLIYKQMGDTEKAEYELAEARKINPDLKA